MYDLTKFTVPTYLFVGDKDFLADPKDVARLEKTLQPILNKKLTILDIPTYEHLDFIWGVDAHTKIYHRIVDDAHAILRESQN